MSDQAEAAMDGRKLATDIQDVTKGGGLDNFRRDFQNIAPTKQNLDEANRQLHAQGILKDLDIVNINNDGSLVLKDRSGTLHTESLDSKEFQNDAGNRHENLGRDGETIVTDNNGAVQQIKEKDGKTTTYTYGDTGLSKIETTNPDGTKESISKDSRGTWTRQYGGQGELQATVSMQPFDEKTGNYEFTQDVPGQNGNGHQLTFKNGSLSQISGYGANLNDVWSLTKDGAWEKRGQGLGSVSVNEDGVVQESFGGNTISYRTGSFRGGKSAMN